MEYKCINLIYILLSLAVVIAIVVLAIEVTYRMDYDTDKLANYYGFSIEHRNLDPNNLKDGLYEVIPILDAMDNDIDKANKYNRVGFGLVLADACIRLIQLLGFCCFYKHPKGFCCIIIMYVVSLMLLICYLTMFGISLDLFAYARKEFNDWGEDYTKNNEIASDLKDDVFNSMYILVAIVVLSCSIPVLMMCSVILFFCCGKPSQTANLPPESSGPVQTTEAQPINNTEEVQNPEPQPIQNTEPQPVKNKEEQPVENKEAELVENKEEQPAENPEEQPAENPEEQPAENKEEQPILNTETELIENKEEQPVENPEEQPAENPETQPVESE